MWNVNLSSLAAKAKEAAARLESQLDDSIGIADDSLFGNKNAATSATGSAGALDAVEEHDAFADDDFFSDDVGEVPLKSEEVEQVSEKLDVTGEEGDDFYGEDENREEEEVDFGGGGGGDGWDEGDDIALDDVVIDEHQEKQQQEEVQIQPQVQSHLLAEGADTIVEMPSMPVQDTETINVQQEEIKPVESGIGSTMVDMPPPIQDEVTEYADETAATELTKEPDSTEVEEIVEDQPQVDQQEYDAEPEPQPVEEYMSQQQQPSGIEMGSSSIEQAVAESMPQDSALPAEQLTESEAISSPPQTAAAAQMDETEKLQFLQTISQLEAQLLQREEQLASKSDQITSLTMQNEAETAKLRQVISETKEEAKKRILKAKERVEEMQTKLSEAVKRADTAGGSSHEQSEIIAALRAEGEQLARKQNQMEQSVRSAKTEARELAENLKIQTEAKEAALQKIADLEQDIKSLKDELSSARKGESQSKKLESDLVSAKEESEKQRVANLGLEQQLSELREENKALKKEVADARAGAALESERESNKLRKERDDMLGDLESKLRTSEREANVREDALRHEVSELRKRWQDAVRRAEDLSMDVQHSTAPLLRQLESTERQNRARASAWAELETKLRADLEEHVIQLEKLTKERNDLRASDRRSQRLLKEKEDEITSSKDTIEALTSTIETLEEKVEKLQEEEKRLTEEKGKLEKQASDGAAKVRSELTQSMLESEERYRSQIEALEAEVADERQRRDNLMKQLDALAENVNAAEFSQTSGFSTGEPSSEQEKKLRGATNQASILHDTLLGIDSDNDDDEEEEDEVIAMQGGSFAAMEQLSQGLKAAKLELVTLRNQLASSEESRENLVEELAEMRQAAEKLPLFESKVSELTMEVNLKDMEIKGLQDDIADVRFLYRQQLDALLEEKAAGPQSSAASETPSGMEEDDPIKIDQD